MTERLTQKFNFDTVFDAGGNVLQEGGSHKNLSRSQIKKLEAEAYDRGRQDQTVMVEQATQQAIQGLSDQLLRLLTSLSELSAENQQQAVMLALSVGKKLAGAALARYEDEQIRWLVQKTLSEIKGEPRVKITVTEQVAAKLEAEIEALKEASSFAGKLQIQIHEQTSPGAVSIEWAEGSVDVDPSEIEMRIEQDISNWFAAAQTNLKTEKSVGEENNNV